MRNFLQKTLTLLLVALAAASLFRVLGLLWSGRKNAQSYRRLAQAVAAPAATAETAVAVDFAALQARNPQLCGWLFWPAVGVELPIAHGTDNLYYLTHGWDGRKNPAGCLFAAAQNGEELTDRCTYVFGHNMANGQMFGSLSAYRDAEFCRQNPTLTLCTPKDTRVLTVFACCPTTDGSGLYRTDFADARDFAGHIAALRAASLYDTGLRPGADSRLVVFSTCDNQTQTGRLLICTADGLRKPQYSYFKEE